MNNATHSQANANGVGSPDWFGGRVRKLRVLTCSLASCRGGVDGCNGSECRRPKWQKMTAAEYQEYFRQPPPNVMMSQPASNAKRSDGSSENCDT